jgi:tetratricopeptide (TPR) repeat protein
VHRNNKGLAHYHADELHKALEEFSKALELDDNDPTIYFNRGNVYLNQKPPDFELAHQDYEMAINIARDNPKLWHSKGLAFQGEAEFEE